MAGQRAGGPAGRPEPSCINWWSNRSHSGWKSSDGNNWKAPLQILCNWKNFFNILLFIPLAVFLLLLRCPKTLFISLLRQDLTFLLSLLQKRDWLKGATRLYYFRELCIWRLCRQRSRGARNVGWPAGFPTKQQLGNHKDEQKKPCLKTLLFSLCLLAHMKKHISGRGHLDIMATTKTPADNQSRDYNEMPGPFLMEGGN